MSEEERVSFIEERDGKPAALKFVEQTLALYMEATIRESKYKESIKFFQKYLAQAK